MSDRDPAEVGDLFSRMVWPEGKKYVSVTIDEGHCLQRLVRDRGASRTLEVGFAYGGSTACIMSGHDTLRGDCSHTSIDPFQKAFGNLGVANMERLGFLPRLDFRPGRSDAVLPALLAEGKSFDFVFIDGSHHFDGILVDFCLADRVLEPGGTVVFHDTWMRSTQLVRAFIRRNRRDYAEERAGAPNLAVFRKVGDDRRPWYHFAEFFTLRGVLTQWRYTRRFRTARDKG